jgi:hypothetical protein
VRLTPYCAGKAKSGNGALGYRGEGVVLYRPRIELHFDTLKSRTTSPNPLQVIKGLCGGANGLLDRPWIMAQQEGLMPSKDSQLLFTQVTSMYTIGAHSNAILLSSGRAI